MNTTFFIIFVPCVREADVSPSPATYQTSPEPARGENTIYTGNYTDKAYYEHCRKQAEYYLAQKPSIYDRRLDELSFRNTM